MPNFIPIIKSNSNHKKDILVPFNVITKTKNNKQLTIRDNFMNILKPSLNENLTNVLFFKAR